MVSSIPLSCLQAEVALLSGVGMMREVPFSTLLIPTVDFRRRQHHGESPDQGLDRYVGGVPERGKVPNVTHDKSGSNLRYFGVEGPQDDYLPGLGGQGNVNCRDIP